MKHRQILRLGLGILLPLLLCLTLLPMTVLADDVKTMTTGDIVAENQPFQVYLGDKPVSTVLVRCQKNGVLMEEYWSKSE